MSVIDRICAAIDAAFQSDSSLRARFPEAPAAGGKPSASLKQHVTDRLGHDRRYAIDETKIRGELGYAPSLQFAEGFAATLRWYLDNEPWWRSIRSRSCGP
jgi:dTDP-glucose 4,6-dehydratase